MAIKGEIFLWIDRAAVGVSANNLFHFGIRVDNNPGTLSEIRPQNSSNVDTDWMYWRSRFLIHGDGDDEEYNGADWIREEVDVRSKRKLDELGMSLGLYIGGQVGNTTTGRVNANLSVLIALP